MKKLLAAALALGLALAAPAQVTAGLHFHGVASGATFTTFDPATAGATLTNGNLTMQPSSGNTGARSLAQLPSSSCAHVEVHIDAAGTGLNFGVQNASHSNTSAASWIGSDTNSLGWGPAGSNLIYGGSSVGPTSPFLVATTGDTVAIEFDGSTHLMRLQVAGGGAWTTAVDYTPSTGTYPVSGPNYFGAECDDPTCKLTVNFGASSFLVTPNSGCVGLS